MSDNTLINQLVNIGFVEPWELSGRLERENQIARIIDAGWNESKHYGNEEECVIIVLNKQFLHNGLECKYFVATPRHQGKAFSDLLNGKTVNCSLLPITEEKAMSVDRFDTSFWRGGNGFIATFELQIKTQ